MIQAKKVTLKTTKTATFNSFAGIDLSSSPMRVASTHAIQAKNIINQYGVNHKRPGILQLSKFSGQINAIIPYGDSYLVHAGTKLYAADGTNKSNGYTLANEKSSYVYINGKIYLWSGNYYKYDGTLTLVSGTIPTTTISIDRDGVTDTAVDTLDDVNLLTPFRKNKLVGYTSGATWTLDGSIDSNTTVTVEVETLVDSVLTTKTYTSSGDSLVDSTSATQGTIDRTNGKITLTGASTPAISNNSNITVTFSHATGSENTIRNMKFGVLFGVNGNANRVFTAGNSSCKNRFYYSELDDPEYFPDMNYADCGQSAINGFARLTDTALAVLKEDSFSEPTIYYTTGTTQTDYDSDGNVSAVTAVFTVTAGAIGAANVNRFCIANLAGDNLMLTKDGVVGMVLSTNISTNIRNIRERSRNINEEIRGADLSDCYACVHDNKYFLALGDVIYVADTRYKIEVEGDIDDSFNYEWWPWEDATPSVLADVKGTLYFGTKNGEVCKYTPNVWVDRWFEITDAGDLALDYTGNKVQYNAGIDKVIRNGDRIVFTSDGVYALYKEATVEDGVFTVTDVRGLYDGLELYLLNDDTAYTVDDIDRGTKTFTLTDCEAEDGDCNLYMKLTGKELIIDKINSYDFQVKEFENSDILDLVIFDSAVSNPIAKIWFLDNVVAEWYTPILDLGSGSVSKTLERISVTTEPSVNGMIEVGYDTRNVSKLIQAHGFDGVFDFSEFDFTTLSFDSGFASSYTKRIFERNVNYIIFKFMSDTDRDMALASLSIDYKFNESNKGVR